MIELFPSIDLREGRVVRLLQGDYEREVPYDDDPVVLARSFADAGARWAHVVDLDGARTGRPVNRAVIERIVAAVPDLLVQCGGGVRSRQSARELIDLGVARAVMGTAALDDLAMVKELATDIPIAVGLDARGDEIAVRGWTEQPGARLLEVLAGLSGSAVEAVIVTQIHRDGMLEGPDVEGLSTVLAHTSLDVVASGGVGSLDDLRALAALPGLAGAIVGRALYERRFTVSEAVAACAA